MGVELERPGASNCGLSPIKVSLNDRYRIATAGQYLRDIGDVLRTLVSKWRELLGVDFWHVSDLLTIIEQHGYRVPAVAIAVLSHELDRVARASVLGNDRWPSFVAHAGYHEVGGRYRSILRSRDEFLLSRCFGLVSRGSLKGASGCYGLPAYLRR
jgi:hypothetical protein